MADETPSDGGDTTIGGPPEGDAIIGATLEGLRRAAEEVEHVGLGLAEQLVAAAVLGRDDIGSLEAGKCADFFSIDLNTVDYAGALHDPVAATVFCAPQKARYTVINGRVVVENGQVVTVNMRPVIDAHNRFARQFAGQS